MKAEIIAIGSELMTGQSLDTNSQWLSRRLAEIGISVGWHTTVADDLEDTTAAFRIATARSRLVIATGGLGPTQDDLTRDALAKLAGVELVCHQESLEHIQGMFRRRQRPMPERNRVQALLPTGAKAIENDRGTAPGIWMRIGDAVAIAMPGVPGEMYAMFESRVKARLVALGLGDSVLLERKINCFGAGESTVEERVADLTRRGHVPDVGITVSGATISLRIVARAATLQDARSQFAPVEQVIRERLGRLVFGVDGEELQDAVVGLLKQKRLSLGTAEGVTAGAVAERLARVPGASAYFHGGMVVYDNRAKVEMLAVPRQLLDEHGAVSAAVVERMAAGCRARFRTDLAISSVGIAGPDGGSLEKPVGLVYVGLAFSGGVSSQTWSWIGSRAEIVSRTAKLALNQVRLHLLQA